LANILIYNVDDKFAEVIKHIHRVYETKQKFQVELNCAGNDIKVHFHHIDPEILYKTYLETNKEEVNDR
jgi:hypothetical protein